MGGGNQPRAIAGPAEPTAKAATKPTTVKIRFMELVLRANL
jgi:hypothetical protein